MTVPELSFDEGTLLVRGCDAAELTDGFRWDARVRAHRSLASAYRALVAKWHAEGRRWTDHARGYVDLDRPHRTDRTPRPYQLEALRAWLDTGRRGTVVLPTGAGKSFVAELCIARGGRSALVVAPTLELVAQWHAQLTRAFGAPVGVLGGGENDPQDITVSTYDSAWMQMPRLGARFGTLVFDEVHHLPGPSFAQAAELSLAPFRLGLTATLERPDGEHRRVDDLVGPVVYRKEITELAGDFLAPYRTEVLQVHLSDEERARYDEARETYRSFVQVCGIRMGGPNGWRRFLVESARSKEGREAFRAWQTYRRLVQAAPAKLRLLAELLHRHRNGRVLIFTHDNATAYEISRRFLVPVITHQTSVSERREWLDAFSSGELPVLATSRVLNEGVDVPAADVAIVLSGTSTVREHVQRLGRVLRPREGKQAMLYEVVVADTVDEQISARRREHDAYRPASSLLSGDEAPA